MDMDHGEREKSIHKPKFHIAKVFFLLHCNYNTIYFIATNVKIVLH